MWVIALCALGVRLGLLWLRPSVGLMEEDTIELSTPMDSWTRFKEGKWLLDHGISPYAGSVYHSSPLLLQFLGQLTPAAFSAVMAFLNVVCVLLISSISATYSRELHQKQQATTEASLPGSPAIPGLVQAFSPLILPSVLVGSTSSLTATFFLGSISAALHHNVPLASFCWAFLSHLSVFNLPLAVCLCLLAGNGIDTPADLGEARAKTSSKHLPAVVLEWLVWSVVWWSFILLLSVLILSSTGADSAVSVLADMFKQTTLFHLNTGDLTPNLGMRWYFFSEVFPDVRDFFSFVFSATILLLLVPLALRLHHRPLFLAFALVSFTNLVTPYPTLPDFGLALSLLSIFLPEISRMNGGFVVLLGYLYALSMGPIMFHLWCIKGIGNANFFYAVTLVFASAQGVLLVQSTWAVLQHDYNSRKSLASYG